MRQRILYLLLSLLTLFFACACSAANLPNPFVQPSTGKVVRSSVSSNNTAIIAHLRLPPGFQISVYASGLRSPRFMTLGPDGVLLVADPSSNSIIALPPGIAAKRAGTPIVIASDLDAPTSLAFHDGYLYVSEATSIVRMTLGNSLQAGSREPVVTGLPLPQPELYGTHTIVIGPDNQLYVSSSADCNACIEDNFQRASVWVYNLDGSQGRLFAKGLPNAVGMAVNPWMGQIWADVNEPDVVGSAHPLPESVYALIYQGDYGWPRCYVGIIRDPTYGQSSDACKGVQSPVATLQAQSTPLGLAFHPLEATQFPDLYRNSLYIALYGSGNSSSPAGYKIVRIPIDCGKMAGHVADFITGWLNSDESSSGRPTGITFAPDGSMFISDDQAGLIYHVWYQNS